MSSRNSSMHAGRIRAAMLAAFCAALVISMVATPLGAQSTYQKPPKEILDVMDAPVIPTGAVDPSGHFMVLFRSVGYPTIADMAQPMLRLAGLRINPLTSATHNSPAFTDFVVKSIPDGVEHKVVLPEGGRFGAPRWSPDGKTFIFTQTTRNATLLWIGDSSGAAHVISGVQIDSVLGGGGGGGRGGGGGACEWMGSARLLCKMVPVDRATTKPPAEPKIPVGPHIEESFGRATAVATFEDLLQDAHDEDLFDYYARSQIATVDLPGGKITPIGKPAVYAGVSAAPGGKYILVTRLNRQTGHYSFLLTDASFPRDIEVWDIAGHVAYKVASQPLEDNLPRNGISPGPRSITWRSNDPSTLVWAEALDGGDPRKQVPQRDKVMWFKAPFTGQPAELLRTGQRFAGITWGEKPDFAIYRDSNMRARHSRTYFFNPVNPAEAPRLVWDLDTGDRYKNPGNPLSRELPSGHSAIRQEGDFIFLDGTGSGPQGDHPFLDRFNIRTLQSERIFQCPDQAYETVVAVIAADGSKFITRHETPTDPPNYFVRTAGSDEAKPVTHFADPTPQIRGIHRELVKYQRADGIPLSMWVYTPADYKPGTRMPGVFWAYPREVASADLAGEIQGSQYRFTTIRGYSELYFLLEGYVVLDDDNAMPVIAAADKPDDANDTYVEQIVADAKAAIDKAADMGVLDPTRVGVGGHSYGAFMTANLLAHSDLFRAGIAESGAYNRTLTPFEFQNERRTVWQVPDLYIKMSPFMFADKLKTPILLIHGEADSNAGTFPIQSERFYRAIKGNGGNVRYVTLPLEAHGYAGKETIEHVVWEKLNWFNKWVKNAPARDANTATGASPSSER
ncbi:MAG TPA: prolyl oligopeptidase family serine peptidase [Candidatus Limnocylindrales bacterium]|nr:prolyl oligopeptidase family serine peptidase [Candidatus Limnocylindrales bacterium]